MQPKSSNPGELNFAKTKIETRMQNVDKWMTLNKLIKS